MAPKKMSHQSSPAYSNGTTLTPSRRSPRVPVTTKAANDSTRSSKSLDITSSPTSQDIRFYYPKTPPPSKPLPSSSPEQPSTRRRVFQARPSRLSNVYTPVMETPNSSSQESRKTRRMTALDTPNGLSSDKDAAENMGSTGWTYDQYMGGLDGPTDPPSPSAASSKGTRSSARLRKPTTRAIEALELKVKPRRKNADPVPESTSPASPAFAASAAADSAATTTATPVSDSVPTPNKDDAIQSAAQSTRKTARKPLKGKKAKKAAKQQKPHLLRIEIDLDTAGYNAYQAAVQAFSTDFTDPPDPDWVINNARFAYFQAQSGLQRTRRASAGDEKQPNLYDSETDTASIGRFQRSAAPQVESDGWSRIGRNNNSGEELMIPPANHDVYWLPHTYGDESLPYPPVRSRSEMQANKDNALGFPPLIGDRNIPFGDQPRFVAEDVTEERARVQARDEARQRAADAPIRTRKTRAVKRRQSAPASNVDLSAPAEDEEREREPKPKRRRRGARASLPTAAATPTTPKPATTGKTPRSKAKSTAKKPAAAADTAPVHAPISAPAPSAKDNEDDHRPIIRLKLKAPKPEGQLNAPIVTNAPQVTTPRGVKGKKRPASFIGDNDATESSGVKRSRMTPGSDLESTPKSGKRASTRKWTPAAKGKEQGEGEASQPYLPPGKASTPKPERNSRTPKGPHHAVTPPSSRGRGRNRGRGRG